MLASLTAFHVLLSLVGILTGFVLVAGFIRSRRRVGVTKWFLVTTFLTSATGFLFPFHGFTPGIGVGILSIIVLAVACVAWNRRDTRRPWNGTFAVTSIIALYFNMFVLVVQLFEKVPALTALAPTQSEPPFAIAQLAVLLAFIALGVLSVNGYRKAAALAA